MPGTFPTNIIHDEGILSSFLTLVNRSQSGKRTADTVNRHFWGFRLRTKLMARVDWQPFFAFLNKNKGRYDTFTFHSTTMTGPLGAVTGSPLVFGAHSKGDQTIQADGFALTTVVFKAGDIIKFDNHAKVYMITDDVTSDGTGLATLNIVPGLMASLADNEGITYDNVPFTMSNTSDVPQMPTDINKYVQLDLELEEVFN